ncbi:MAG: hypothetical protein JO362_05360 [Streptomycetaceae bacterium]|nr:hypothetical protein [Streptomycetaceae bacterium]
MPVPSKRLKDDVDGTVDHHAAQQGRWPALAEVDVRWRGSFGYLAAIIEHDGQDEHIPLCRIEYLGDDEEWAFAIYSAATDSYTGALLHTGTDVGPPNDAFDTAAIVHLADHEA